MIKYYIELQFRPKDPNILGSIYKKNQWIKPDKSDIYIRYEVSCRSINLEKALKKLKVRMKDTKNYEFVAWKHIARRKF